MDALHFKKIFKILLSEKTSAMIGNLSYLTILALAPTAIITTSLLNVLSNYIELKNIPNFEKLVNISQILNLNQTTSLIINLICLNFLSSGIFSLLSTLENIYDLKFKNYFTKKLYSIALALVILLIIITVITISFLITKNSFLKKIDFITNLICIFISILLFYKFSTFQKLKKLYPGALISAFFLAVFLSFFYYIIDNFSNLKSYYGILAPVIISVILIYYSCYIIYLGILLNVEFSNKKPHKNHIMNK